MSSGSMLFRLLTAMVKMDASDLHLKVGKRPSVRIHGDLRPLETKEIDSAMMQTLLGEAIACTPSASQFTVAFSEDGSIDFSFSTLTQEFDGGRTFRVNAAKEHAGPSMVIRLVSKDVLSPEQIGLKRALVNCVERQEGLILVTGPTGSGKSTTLASLIEHINQNFPKRIVTIENPIEYYFSDSGKGFITQREVPRHTKSFLLALEDALRQDPDVIMFGEIRDEDVLLAAINAAETGHIVLGTLHTKSAPGTVQRVLGLAGDDSQAVQHAFAGAISAIVCQKLIPRIGGGRVMAYELMIVDDGIRNLIRMGKIEQLGSRIQTGGGQGMQLLDDHILFLLQQGVITRENALGFARDPAAMARRIVSGGQVD